MELTRITSSVPLTTPADPSEKVQELPTNGNKQNEYQPNPKELKEMVKGINDLLIPTHTSSKFVLHEKLNDYYIQIIDDKTQEVIKELPSKKFLDMYASMLENVGLFIDKKI
ncbi:flagellar protein FlaG [Fictibacillus sp. KU28468]|uniref:flagellar protein FlaG n=1 Tax=Fictibacillus sp. KU28468 TaxID=2991053 RepID=UPI00223DCA66|nr:flagellar protein FlaG [Fictibacillus sp. KU28468]UZJ79694.1 flagellar protein FlaG [Fictibacillus sp. KU28468]